MCKKSEIGLKKNFYQNKEFFSKNFDFENTCKNEIEKNKEKFAVDSAIKFPTKSI